MNLLIIGGTQFLGRALVESALASGHQVTLFHRGRTNPGLFPQVEHLTGDRKGDLSLLTNRSWDGVIDTCGYDPVTAGASARLLAPAVERYIFISSISVYADLSRPGVDEQAPVEPLPAGADMITVKGETYGPLKALSEQAVEAELPGRSLIIRPGLIVGQYDPTDRFTYWPWRVAQGGEVLAPGRPGYPVQFIDVRDLAGWTIRMFEARKTGVYNATGPDREVTLGELLKTCRAVSGSDATLRWVDEVFLLENGVQPWSELPLWLPEGDRSTAGMNQVSIQKAVQDGLSFRLLEDTVQSTLKWAKNRPADHNWRAGLSRKREAELLKKLDG